MKLLEMCLLFGTTLAPISACAYKPREWRRSGTRDYVYFDDARTWAQAQNVCVNYGGNLATVHDNKLDNFLKDLAQNKRAWIGFSDAQEEGHWLRINGQPDIFDNWCKGEPSNDHGDRHCAVINWTGNKCWDDERCKALFPFICERK